MADLGRWLSGDYRVPARANEEDEERPETGGDPPIDPDDER
jgi:endogenous inhibitor of DNA gyrase (YacG/DUF329 family)